MLTAMVLVASTAAPTQFVQTERRGPIAQLSFGRERVRTTVNGYSNGFAYGGFNAPFAGGFERDGFRFVPRTVWEPRIQWVPRTQWDSFAAPRRDGGSIRFTYQGAEGRTLTFERRLGGGGWGGREWVGGGGYQPIRPLSNGFCRGGG